MGFKIGNRKKRHRAESADSDFDAFRDDGYVNYDEFPEEDYPEDEYAEDFSEEGYSEEEYSEERFSEEGFSEDEEYYEEEYSEYGDDGDYVEEDEYASEEYAEDEYDEEYNTASFDTASLEMLSQVDYDTASIDYERVRQTVEEQEYFDDEVGYDTASLDYTSEIGYDTASLDYTGEIGYKTESFDARDIGEIVGFEEVVKPRKPRTVEEDEYIDLDDNYDPDYEPIKHRKGKLAIIIAAAAAVLLIAIFGVWTLKDRILNHSGNTGGMQVSDAGIPYSEQMLGAGNEISGINMIGQSGLYSALDARKNSLTAEPAISDDHDYGETDIITRTSVSIELITVKSDLKIRFINNETGKLIANVAFKVTVTDPTGKALTWTDDDLDGIIYKTSISEGKYTVHVEQIEGDSYQGFSWPADKTVTVKNTIEYSRVDVQGEVKDAAQVNENAEDTASRGNTSGQDMSNTVETIDSSTTTLYTEIGKDTIADPNPAPTPEPSPSPTEDVSGNESPSPSPEPSPSPTVDMNAQLKDKSGNEVYVYENDTYRKATNADYAKFDKFYIVSGVKYTGWQTFDGATYYYDKDGKPVTGTQVINGVTYQFGSDGKMSSASGVLGIDVSKWQGAIDWNAVKAAGVEFVIIRVGYRGSSAGALIDDSMFATNIQGAKAAGLKVGVYFVTQAVNDVEAVYEASMVLDRIKGYSLDYPVFLDVEASGGRGDTIDKATRTAVITAFCETIRSAGYTAGIYANKTWLGTKMDTSAFGNYVIWVAHYSSVCGYTGRYNVWQYTDKGTLPGINGCVDLNLWYS